MSRQIGRRVLAMCALVFSALGCGNAGGSATGAPTATASPPSASGSAYASASTSAIVEDSASAKPMSREERARAVASMIERNGIGNLDAIGSSSASPVPPKR